MRFAALFIAALAALCPGYSSGGKEKVKPTASPSEATLKRIAASDENKRVEILRQLTKDRSDLQTQLIRELDAATDKDKKCAFVYLMGLYRLEGTVSELAKIIELESKQGPSDALPLWGQYPVVDALIKIGRPAVPAMLENIKSARGEKVTELSVGVIRYVETPAIARVILQEAAAQEKDPNKRKAIQDALKHIKDN